MQPTVTCHAAMQNICAHNLVKQLTEVIRPDGNTINTANCTIAQRLDYDEFGNVTQDTNPGFQPFGFAGGLYDAQTKLVRFGARDYDAQPGRWTTKDPIGFDGGDANIYAFVGGNPVSKSDPFGLVPVGAIPTDPNGAAIFYNLPKRRPPSCTCPINANPGEVIGGTTLGFASAAAGAFYMTVAGTMIVGSAGAGAVVLVVGGLYLYNNTSPICPPEQCSKCP